MSQSESIAELAKALCAFQGEMGAVPKTAENPFFRSRYADLAAIVKAATPVLSKHGLSIHQAPSHLIVSGELHHTLKTKVFHTSGEWTEDEMVLIPVKLDPQGQGSAITYGRRYAYSAALGIVADEDDDGNAASNGNGAARANTTTRRAPPTGAASEAQVNAIHAISKSLGKPSPTEPEGGWTKAQASALIDELQAQKAPA